ncbi:MAG: hypothetical protein Q7T19_00325 [Caulobacter sp.]|nr:hypothetical protein [Caulobacter sp.]
MTSPALVRRLTALVFGALLAVGWAAPRAEARWLRAETPHFVLYSDGPEANLRWFATDLEDFDALMRAAHGLDPAGVPARKLDIYLVAGHDDLSRVLPSATGSIGFYRANLGDIYAVAIRGERGSGNGRQLLFHEYVHHFMLQNFHAAYPAWLVEGYAEYFGATRVESDRIEVGVVPEGRARDLANHLWLPLREVAGLSRPTGTGTTARNRAAMYYAQSWLLTHYMLGDPARKARLGEYLLAVGRGEDPVKALEAAMGMDLVAAEKTLKTYLRSTQGIRYPRSGQPRTDVAMTRLAPSADALLLEGQRLKSGVPEAERPALLSLIRERAARFPGDRFADLTLARAEISFGDRAAGEAILTRRIDADARDVDALWLMALSGLFAGQAEPARRVELYAQARPWLGKAFAIDPNRYQILYDFAQSRSVLPDYPTDNTLAALLRAHELAPQVAPITLAAGRALMKRERFDAAIALLSPLANSPHGGSLAVAAQRLIAQARGRQQASPAGEDEPEDAQAPAPG